MAFLRELWYRQTWETGVFFHLCFIRRERKKEKDREEGQEQEEERREDKRKDRTDRDIG